MLEKLLRFSASFHFFNCCCCGCHCELLFVFFPCCCILCLLIVATETLSCVCFLLAARTHLSQQRSSVSATGRACEHRSPMSVTDTLQAFCDKFDLAISPHIQRRFDLKELHFNLTCSSRPNTSVTQPPSLTPDMWPCQLLCVPVPVKWHLLSHLLPSEGEDRGQPALEIQRNLRTSPAM